MGMSTQEKDAQLLQGISIHDHRRSVLMVIVDGTVIMGTGGNQMVQPCHASLSLFFSRSHSTMAIIIIIICQWHGGAAAAATTTTTTTRRKRKKKVL
jgi:hypothetical protein